MWVEDQSSNRVKLLSDTVSWLYYVLDELRITRLLSMPVHTGRTTFEGGEVGGQRSPELINEFVLLTQPIFLWDQDTVNSTFHTDFHA